jgi:hypothetical protein
MRGGGLFDSGSVRLCPPRGAVATEPPLVFVEITTHPRHAAINLCEIGSQRSIATWSHQVILTVFCSEFSRWSVTEMAEVWIIRGNDSLFEDAGAQAPAASRRQNLGSAVVRRTRHECQRDSDSLRSDGRGGLNKANGVALSTNDQTAINNGNTDIVKAFNNADGTGSIAQITIAATGKNKGQATCAQNSVLAYVAASDPLAQDMI